ncbi:MAG: CBU_0665 family Dot/Icm T4SS effector [Coxiella burnetii]|nr:CBU_0665 family Dot/Icm T4SS effector [Coxiella burnetii]
MLLRGIIVSRESKGESKLLSEEQTETKVFHSFISHLLGDADSVSRPKEFASFWETYRVLNYKDLFEEYHPHNRNEQNRIKENALDILVDAANQPTAYLRRNNYIKTRMINAGIPAEAIEKKNTERVRLGIKKSICLEGIRLNGDILETPNYGFVTPLTYPEHLALMRELYSEQLPCIRHINLLFMNFRYGWRGYSSKQHIVELCEIIESTKQLQSLDLANCQIRADNLKMVLQTIIGDSQRSQSLQKLVLDCNYLSKDLLNFIKNDLLPQCQNLSELSLNYVMEDVFTEDSKFIESGTDSETCEHLIAEIQQLLSMGARDQMGLTRLQ